MDHFADYDACKAIVKTLPYVSNYNYGDLLKALTSPPSHSGIWEGCELLRRSYVIQDLSDGWIEDVPNGVLYALCEWVDEASDPDVRAKHPHVQTANVAIIDMWDMDLVKRLWGKPGNVSGVSRLALAIIELYESAVKVPAGLRRHIYVTVSDLIVYYQEDLTLPGESTSAQRIVNKLRAASQGYGRREHERINGVLKATLPLAWDSVMAWLSHPVGHDG